MDDHSLQVLEFQEVKDLLGSYAGSPLGRAVIAELRPAPDGERLRLSLRRGAAM